jgi:hypothetical protein
MGKDTFEAAMEDPNSLGKVEFDGSDPCYEGYQYAVNDALEERFGEIPSSEVGFPSDPSGEEWDEDSVEEMFPGLECIDGVVEASQGPVTESKPWWKFW